VKSIEKLLLTYRETSEILGISMRSLTRAVKQGELIPVQAPGTRGRSGRRFLAQDVENRVALLGMKAQGIAPPSPSKQKRTQLSRIQMRSVGEVVDSVLERKGSINPKVSPPKKAESVTLESQPI
jgi:hypothetical protein